MIYESEVFDDVSALAPALIVSVNNPVECDCKLRINVYYSSSLTNAKDVLIAATSFGLRDMLRCHKNVFSSSMVSEHCSHAVAFIRQIHPLISVLKTEGLSSNAPRRIPWNPMFQRYIFHPLVDNSAPVVCEEHTWEPRLAFKVPLVFLQNLSDVMSETIKVWKLRAQLERVRRGCFSSREEAFLNGWYETSICVSACRIEAESTIPEESWMDGTGQGGRHDSTDKSRVRVDSEGSVEATAVRQRKSSTTSCRMPASFVEAILEHRDLPFSAHVGKTNTEYNTLQPMYGSNLYSAGQGRSKGPQQQVCSEYQISPLADPDNVRISRIPHNFEMPTFGDTGTPATRHGVRSIFHMYTPFAGGGRLRLELKFEDYNTGKESLVGVCYIPLQNIPVVSRGEPSSIEQTWVPVQLLNPTSDPKWSVINAEILVGVSVQQEVQQNVNGLPPVSPHLPHVMEINPETSSVAFNPVTSLLSEDSGIQKITSPSRRLSALLSVSSKSTGENESQDQTIPADIKDSVVVFGSGTSDMSAVHEPDSDDDTDDEDETPTISIPATAAVPVVDSSSSPVEHGFSPSNGQALWSTDANPGRPVDMRRAAQHSARILAECYEWMWHIGFKGVDPLGIYPEHTDGIALEDRPLVPRADVRYSSTWLTEHIRTFEELLCHIKCLTAYYSEEVSEDRTFRASRLKKEIEFQALPVNLHMQIMTMLKCNGTDSCPNTSSDDGFVRVADSVTCGATAAHALGYKNGGLSNIEMDLQRSKATIDNMKQQFVSADSIRLAAKSHDTTPCFSCHGKEATLMDSLTSTVVAYETSIANVTVRRMYCLSQVLSICANAFLYKVELVLEGHIPSFFIERWLTHGFLLLFECLLSVNGKERGMIEDARTSVEMLNLYRIRILPLPSSDVGVLESNSWFVEHCKVTKRRWWEAMEPDKTDVHIVGREILLLVPVCTVLLFPESVRDRIMSEGAVFKLCSVLFSQGIDIMQSITNTWDSYEAGISSKDLQLQININGLHKLNAYCESVQPIHVDGERTRSKESRAVHVYSGLTCDAHPLTGVLEQLIQNTNPNSKNVEMLIEVERICRMLGGCRTTFCKSGKDRTGMAVTLEQSRLLGENFDCGQSAERIIKDASIMRQYGTRLMVAAKNIGRPVYAINRLQIQFLPAFYRPPLEVTEELIKKTDNS
eukprot:CAMPEP_0185030682 /NCGR_PEP_ID=MMETSP1103-20130426/17681_1 /TAXON_ID=36769 /ORGANISM="Paraphysomonas bandaiensis, Strain Caron Lab Isolate" /LENGTH=1178 /DNA_ID=CAMNT_0027565895 /DNA_START=347 /DNA_END=3883 /DNA_ORIENTATION=-